MKKLLTTVFTALILLNSCFMNQQVNPGEKKIKNLSVPGNFNWKTFISVHFTINNVPQGAIKITSGKGLVYYKSYQQTPQGSIETDVNIPAYEKSVLINGYTVQLNGNVVVFDMPGKEGFRDVTYSLHYDGINDLVKVPDNATLSDINEITLEAWIKLEELGGDDKCIINKADEYELKLQSAGDKLKPLGVIYTDNNQEQISVSDVNALQDTGVWYHLALVYDGTEMRLYINSELKNTKSVSGHINPEHDWLTFGGDISGNNLFKGKIADARVWRIARSYSELFANMNQPLTGSETGLAGYWPGTAGTGATIYDASSNNNDGQIWGPSWSSDIPFTAVDTDGDGVDDANDDYPNDPVRAFDNFFPAAGYGSLAFEDLWPYSGDYDFNDLVVDYLFRTVTDAQNKLVGSTASIVVRAFGAGMHNGFGFQIGSPAMLGNMSVSGYQVTPDYVSLDANGLETGQNKPTIIVFEDAYEILTYPSDGSVGVNTNPSGTYVDPDTLSVAMTFSPGIFELSELDVSNFNPFLIIDGQRSHEVHLPDYAPTQLADTSLLGTGDDRSIPDSGRYYKTENNLPWVLNIYKSFDYPVEKAEITQGYLHFSDWAQSSGNNYGDWYLDSAGYRNTSVIFQPPSK